ncbi:IclR family transcriptional regulator [Frigoribacterium sp. CG_9.8]|uniref:IclR family transcriptional regulator n=1 Tax=Frigoribacterium sp. CG_9.8 TaxID=2787733 RepID=UPI0018CBB4B9|nr:IclR family transcriptional regulator [Frigoribacterium sp. CG_9.8]MBG6106437.1 DNA-binding IclR family transcriptional regulator [Frigoribacterium sp. CG_9.8]
MSAAETHVDLSTEDRANTDDHVSADDRVVGSDRVLAVLVELAKYPDGVSLDEMARAVSSSKPTVHRALASLCRARLAAKDGRGRYLLGDEFLRLAFANHELRPDHLRVQPILDRLAERYGETAHYAVLDGEDIVYRSKVDPAIGAMRLTSTVGGRNPAHSTAVGKMLLCLTLPDLQAVERWVGNRVLARQTSRTATTALMLHEQLETVRERGYSVDDEENESGVNCLALPIYLTSPTEPSGAVSISALAYRTPLTRLVDELPVIRSIIEGTFDEHSS